MPKSVDLHVRDLRLGVSMAGETSMMDDDLEGMSREQLIAEVKTLRGGIREHRDSSLHDLCWHQPALWGLSTRRRPILFRLFRRGRNFMRGCRVSAIS